MQNTRITHQRKVMTYLLFTVALALSAIAAYYAIMGLIAIFAAAVIPIAIMGSLLETSKLVVASWLYQNWKQVPVLLKSYFTIALLVLMLLTSMGIFGFLSKAHLDQAVPTGDVSAKLSLIDERIKTEKENLNASRQELNQLDVQVNQTIARTDGATDTRAVERSIQIRRNQQKDRNRILNEIGTTQAKIAKLQEERAPIASEVRKVEAEVGPIKYIAALMYGDNIDEGLLEKAVRIVTIMIVVVFDPLAVLMLVAANWQLKQQKPKYEQDDGPLTEDQLEEIKKQTVVEPSIVKPLTENTPESKDWEPQFYDRVGAELPEIKVEEQTVDITPETYDVRRGDVITKEQYPDNKDVPPKTASFMRKMADFIRPSGKTIEKEVEELQNKNPK